MNRKTHNHLNLLGIAITTALLSACGGGGGGNAVRPDPPPPPPPPQVCNDSRATNQGGPLPCTYRYNGEADNLLVPVNADLVHAEGFTGKGVKVGVLDNFQAGKGAIEQYAPLEGKFYLYFGFPENSASERNELTLHGVAVSTVLAGSSVPAFNGGVAPDSKLYASHGYNHHTLIQSGVRLFNLSAGDAYDSNNPKAPVDSWANLFWRIASDGALLIESPRSSSKNTGMFRAKPCP